MGVPAIPDLACDAGELRRARRRMSSVDADNAAKVLRHDRYWTSAFWHLYRQECRLLRLRDPSAAHKLAVHAPQLVSRIERLGLSGGARAGMVFRSEAERSSAAVRSWALLADCERLCGRFEASRQAFARAGEEAARSGKISFAAFSELRRESVRQELAAGRGQDAWAQLDELATASDALITDQAQIDDETSQQFAETLLLLGSARQWLDASSWSGQSSRSAPDSDLAALARCAFFACPRRPLGAAIFDAALDLLDRRLNGERPTPAVLEPAGAWLRQARRQSFRRGERLRRTRLLWSEGRVLSLLGITRLAQRRLQRVCDELSSAGDPLRLALVTLDLVILDVGFDDRERASCRLARAREALAREHTELDELLRQARQASWDSLLVFRRRLARRLERQPPAALVPRPPTSETVYSAPSLGGVA